MTGDTSHPSRVRSLDVLRGLVMVIMALDHCRDFFGPTPFQPWDLSSSTTPAWFLTRWVTHFCAPVFVFLAGTSAWLYKSQRRVSTRQLAWFLVSRGVWLIIVEIAIIGVLLHFGSYPFFFLQVIWVIGWSMLLMALMIFLPTWVVAAVGFAMVCGHNLLDTYTTSPWGGGDFLWQLLHVQGFSPTTPLPTIVAYPLVPWPGVMALGYCFGRVFELSPARRDRICYLIGGACVLLFFLLRWPNLYGDPALWSYHEKGKWFSLLSFINTTKYPPSLLFLLMTIGPSLALLPSLEKLPARFTSPLRVFGSVPFFFYVAHWFVIRAGSWTWIKWQFGSTLNLIFAPATDWPEDYEPSLMRVYICWALVVLLLYPCCLWYSRLRASHRNWRWLSYL